MENIILMNDFKKSIEQEYNNTCPICGDKLIFSDIETRAACFCCEWEIVP